MNHRKGYKAYLINGFANGVKEGQALCNRLYNFIWRVDVRWSLTVILGAMAILGHNLFAAIASGTVYAIGINAFKLDKKGATADNLALLNDLEERMSKIPEQLQKDIVDGILKEELEKRFAPLAKLTADEVTKLIDFASDDKDKGIRSSVLKLAEDLKLMKSQADARPKDMSVRGQINDWRANVEVKAVFDAVEKRGGKFKLTASEVAVLERNPLALRAADSPMTPATAFNPGAAANQSLFIPQPQFEAGINEVVRVQPTFWDYLPKGRSSSATYVWVNKKVPAGSGAADFISPGVAKPKVSFVIKSEFSQAKKVAATEKLAMETLFDVDGFQSWAEQELYYQVKQLANTTCLTTGDTAADADTPNSVKKLSVAFAAVGLSTVNPNNWDVGRAVAAQIRASNLVGPITIFVNPIDKANMDMTKAVSQGQLYQPGPQYVNWIEDNNIPVGSFQAGIMSYYRILMYQDLVLDYGLVNDDFEKNLITVRAEMRFHQTFSENYTGAFVFDTFANVKAAIAGV